MNTTGQIAETLEELLKVGGGRNNSMSAAWANKFGVAENTSAYFTCISAMYYQYEGVLTEIQSSTASDRAKGLFASAAQSLQPFIHPLQLAGHNTSQLQNAQGSIDTLFLAAEAIGNRLVPEVNKLTIDELVKELSDLKDEVSKMDVDERLRKIIFDQLNLIQISIHAYSTLGPQGAAKVYGGAVAELARIARKETAKPAEKKAIARAIDLAKKAGAAVVWAAAVVSGASDLLEDGTALLGLTAAADTSGEVK